MRIPARIFHKISKTLKSDLVDTDTQIIIKHTTRDGNIVYAELNDAITVITVDVYNEEID